VSDRGKRSRKERSDANQLAASIVAQATDQPEPKPEKNPAAVALGFAAHQE